MPKEVTQNISSVFKLQIMQKNKHIRLTPLKIKPMNNQPKTNLLTNLHLFKSLRKLNKLWYMYVQKVNTRGWFQTLWQEIEGISQLRDFSETAVCHLSKQHLLWCFQLKHLRMIIDEAKLDGALSNRIYRSSPCLWEEDWNKMIFKGPSNSNHSMILWMQWGYRGLKCSEKRKICTEGVLG